MKLRKSKKNDLERIMEMIRQAQDYFKSNNIDQWQNNYPNNEVIINDIEKGYSYVLERNGEIVASTAVSFNNEENYNKIYKGNWLTNEDYTVIHRGVVDMDFKGKGLFSIVIKEVEKISLSKGIHSIKIDTHKDNLAMQKLIKKNNFKYCGIIYLKDGNERIAFEKEI